MKIKGASSIRNTFFYSAISEVVNCGQVVLELNIISDILRFHLRFVNVAPQFETYFYATNWNYSAFKAQRCFFLRKSLWHDGKLNQNLYTYGRITATRFHTLSLFVSNRINHLFYFDWWTAPREFEIWNIRNQSDTLYQNNVTSL